jgi:hypothetical protein
MRQVGDAARVGRLRYYRYGGIRPLYYRFQPTCLSVSIDVSFRVIRRFGGRVELAKQTWEQEMMARAQLINTRESLRIVLEERFGPLPEALMRQIESIDDPERLRTGLRQVVHISTLAELKL